MYIPSYFRNESWQEAEAFIRKNPFGIMVYEGPSGRDAVHSPFLLEEEEGMPVLYTHIARVPGRLKTAGVLCIFSGAHGYVSPSWYADPRNVPTWNYSALHVRGMATEQEPDDYPEFMTRMIAFFDPGWLPEWHKSDPDYIGNLYRGIILLRIPLQHFDFANKLSQNKPAADRRRIASRLGERGNRELASDMLYSLENDDKLDG